MIILTSKDIKQFTFPDGQPHIQIPLCYYQDIKLIWRVRSAVELLQLCMISEALSSRAEKTELVIPYLMGARFDRRMQPGDSFDLNVIAKIINNCGWRKVTLFDVHSDVATALIERSENIGNNALLGIYNKKDAVLIIPDAGAAKKAQTWAGSTVQCLKHRDTSTGNIKLEVINPEKCRDRNCVIIDDLCDGGATFISIAKQITPKHLTLIVSHGIFSKGFEELNKYFDHIITSTSYQNVVMIKGPGYTPPKNLTQLEVSL